MSVDNLSGSLLRLDNYEGQPFSTTCGDHYFYPAPFQTGQVCSTERIPEASGVDGVSLLGLPLGLLHMRLLQFWLKSRVPWRTWTSGHLHILVNHSCISALKLWCNLDMYRRGMTLGLVTRCTIVMTDVSTSGWGTVSVGSPTSGLWSESQREWHMKSLELRAVSLALEAFLPQLKQRHVLIRTDNRSVVSYINRQAGIRSRPLFKKAVGLLLWADRPFSPSG